MQENTDHMFKLASRDAKQAYLEKLVYENQAALEAARERKKTIDIEAYKRARFMVHRVEFLRQKKHQFL